ncbi:uncharacterized protein CEXT_741231 [Caerostris extrusa]|uniref:Uncharacterized protein n=1 Tax=Caerostris extrusa TaxID=172846 RepID=A0AAV4P6F0_CAEEX|nr:uncharacterized protein CEXT_741231 [Caerostris extrusa]
MKLSTPSSLGLLQLLIACILVAIYTCPGDAMHHGPMIIFKAGKGMAHGGGGMGGALGLLAAGLLIKSLTHLEKHQHHHQGGGYGGWWNGLRSWNGLRPTVFCQS